MKTKLIRVAVRDGVPFDGPSTQTLMHTAGDLEYDSDAHVVICTPRNGGRTFIVPLATIKFMEVMDPRVEKGLEERKKALAKAQADAEEEAKKPKPVVDDTVRLRPGSKA